MDSAYLTESELEAFNKIHYQLNQMTEEEYQEAIILLETLNLNKAYSFEKIKEYTRTEKQDSPIVYKISYVFATKDAENNYPNMRVDFEAMLFEEDIDYDNVPTHLLPLETSRDIKGTTEVKNGSEICGVDITFEPISFKKRVQIDRDTQERKVKKVYRPTGTSAKERFEDLTGKGDLRVLTTVAAITLAFIDDIGPDLGGTFLMFGGAGDAKEKHIKNLNINTRRTKLYIKMIERLSGEFRKRKLVTLSPEANFVIIGSKLTTDVIQELSNANALEQV